MTILIVDTSIWIELLKNKPYPMVDEALSESRIILPPLVVSELYAGASSITDQTWLDAMTENIPICKTPVDHWRKVGQLRLLLIKKGLHISTPDAHIAQCAIDIDGQLLSHDKIFEKSAKFCGLRLAKN